MRRITLNRLSIVLAAALAAGTASADPKFTRVPGAPEPEATAKLRVTEPAPEAEAKPAEGAAETEAAAPAKPRFQRPKTIDQGGTAQVIVTAGDAKGVYEFDLAECSVTSESVRLASAAGAVPGFELVYDGATQQGYSVVRVEGGSEIRATGGAFDVTDGAPSGAYDLAGGDGKVIFKSQCK